MTELKDKYKAFMEDLENKINNKNDLEYIKSRFTELFMLFLDEFDKLTTEYEEKMQNLIINQKALVEKVNKVEEAVSTLEKDIYADDAYDFEIICPYCNNSFIIDFNSEEKTEVKCPECNNIIELDWNDEDEEEHDCMGHCSHCESFGMCEESDNEEDYIDDQAQEDDM